MSDQPLIAVIHTSPATVDLFARLLKERLPGHRIMNLLDDSILPELRDNGAEVAAVLPRWRRYAEVAKGQGARLILNACSSIGEICGPVEDDLGIPVIRVDADMAREAVRRGDRIAVAATLRTTLRPTVDLLTRTAAESERSDVRVEPALVEGAYEALISGDQARHDDLLAAALERAARGADVVVLAQASMARVLPRLSEAARAKCLTSPPFAVERVVATASAGGRAPSGAIRA